MTNASGNLKEFINEIFIEKSEEFMWKHDEFVWKSEKNLYGQPYSKYSFFWLQMYSKYRFSSSIPGMPGEAKISIPYSM